MTLDGAVKFFQAKDDAGLVLGGTVKVVRSGCILEAGTEKVCQWIGCERKRGVKEGCLGPEQLEGASCHQRGREGWGGQAGQGVGCSMLDLLDMKRIRPLSGDDE